MKTLVNKCIKALLTEENACARPGEKKAIILLIPAAIPPKNVIIDDIAALTICGKKLQNCSQPFTNKRN